MKLSPLSDPETGQPGKAQSVGTPSPTPTIVPSEAMNPLADQPVSFPPLKQTSTALTTASARQAARTLDNFSTSSADPHNWSHSKKWRISMTVALTGFISTCGSSIGVPGIHAVMDQFGVTNEKIGVLITTVYVLGLGYVDRWRSDSG